MMQTIRVKFLPATDKKPARWKASTDIKSVILSYSNHTANDAAIAVAKQMEWCGDMVRGAVDNGFVYVFTTDETITLAPIKRYQIREGDGNDGEYKRGIIVADDAFEALTRASKSGMISKPRDVTYDSFDGDEQQCHAASYVAPIYGDSCRWCASASLITYGGNE